MGWVGLAVAVLTLLTALLGFMQLHRKVAEVHVLVNARLDEALAKISELEREAGAHGTP
jgi:hypothetical protein